MAAKDHMDKEEYPGPGLYVEETVIFHPKPQNQENMVTIETYAREVKHMRSLQQRYFQTRAKSVLMVAKVQERKVDEITEKILLAL